MSSILSRMSNIQNIRSNLFFCSFQSNYHLLLINNMVYEKIIFLLTFCFVLVIMFFFMYTKQHDIEEEEKIF